MSKKDIRIRLLEKLKKNNKGTEEFVANDFLNELHNDLGTLKRSLIELVDFDLIRESNVEKDDGKKSVIRNIDTDTADLSKSDIDNKKSSLRLLNNVGAFSKIKPIRLTITVKGLQFLVENEKLGVDLTLSKWQKKWFWPVAISGVIGLAIAIISLIVTFF